MRELLAKYPNGINDFSVEANWQLPISPPIVAQGNGSAIQASSELPTPQQDGMAS